MPGGLPEIVQPVGADTSRYKSEWLSVLPVLSQVSDAQKAIIGQAGDIAKAMQAMHGTGGGAAAAADIAKTNAAIRDQLAALREAQPAIAAVKAATGDYASVVQYLGSTHADLAPQIRATTAAIGDHADSLGRLTQVASAATDAVADHAVVLGRAADAHGSGAGSVLEYVTSLGLLESKAKSATSAMADTAAAARLMDRVGAGGGGSSGGGAMDAATAAIIARNLTRQGLRPNPASSGADQAAISAAMSALGGGGGFFGGGGGSGGGGGGPGPFLSRAGDPGSAGSDARAVVGFVQRWWGAAHWAMMATNEVLATAGPAAAAAGAAALVGLQGAQQLTNRYNAINTTAEALGGAYGQTSGSFMGTGSALQQYQNAAGGGVYELAGAGINFLKGGGGNGFLQAGQNTIAMLDRGVADMQANMQARGTAGQLAQLAGGGTGYLRQFGDIGSNLGNLFLGLAPNLPGVGGDYLSALEGITGAASGGVGFLNQHGAGNILGAGLAAEAGFRVGKPLVGLAGMGLQRAGLGLAGLGGDSLLGEAGLGIGTAGEALMALGGPEIATAAAGAYLVSKSTAGVPFQKMGALQAGINQAGFSGAWQPLGKAVTTATGLASTAPTGPSYEGTPWQQPLIQGRFGAVGATAAQVYANSADSFSKQMGNLVNSGPQLQAALAKAGLKGASLGDSFQIAQNALLDMSHAFNSHGQLTQQAKQMLANYVSAIGPMTQNAGAFGAAIGSQTIMGSEQMGDLAKVNQSMDSMTQIMTGTAMGASGLAGTTAALTPATARALGSVTSPGSAAAWSTFVGTASTPGTITQLQSFNDQMRTNLTLGTSTSRQAQGMTGYEIQKAVQTLGPGLKKDPAALAMLMQQAAQQGIGGYYQGGAGDAAKNYAALEKSLKNSADSAKQMNADSTAATIKNSQISTLANKFTQGTAADIQSQQIVNAAKDAMNIKSGVNVKGSANDLLSQLKASGVSGAPALKQSMDAVLKQAGVSQTMRVKIEADTSGLKAAVSAAASAGMKAGTGTATPHVTASQLQTMGAAMHGGTVNYTAKVEKPVAPPAPKGGVSEYTSRVQKPVAPPAPHGGTVIYNSVVIPPTAANNPYAGGISGRAGMATGGLVPGTGSGDIVPAMLTPGEVVIPRNLVSQLAPFLAAHGVPGFGSPGGSSTHFAAGGLVSSPGGATLATIQAQINAVWQQLDALYKQKSAGSTTAGAQISALWKNQLDPLYAQKSALSSGSSATAAQTAAAKKTAADFVATVSGEISKGGAQKIAQSLVHTLGTELAYGRQVSSAAQSGLNLAGMTAGVGGISGAGAAAPGTPGYNQTAWNAAVANAAGNGPAPSVQDQMQSYLGSVKAFTGDLRTLSAQHLNKATMGQLIGAGPVQGDQLAQSILGSAGGVKLTNSLQSQLVKASNALGAQSAMSMYGNKVAPNLQSASASKTVDVQGKTATVGVKVEGVSAVQAAINSIQGKTVTIAIQTVSSGGATIGSMSAKGLAGGGLVPGTGYGDIVPAMLTPGEAVIPRSMVPVLSPLLQQLGIPGFSGSTNWDQFNKHMGLGGASGPPGQGTGGASGPPGQGTGMSGPGAFRGGPPNGMTWVQWISQGIRWNNTPQQQGASGMPGHSLAVNVSVGGGSLNLTRAHISDIAAQVQSELLRQARTNPGTGLQLSGRGT